MLPRPIRRHWRLAAGGVLVLVVGLLGAAVVAMGGSSDVVVYNGRSQYGDEPAFRAFEERTGLDVELRGGTAPELFERLRGEGADTPADLLVTTDLANLWRAEQAGLLQPVDTPALQRNVPRDLRDAQGTWWGMSLRVRTMMRSTERVKDGALETYADLGDRRWRGRLCLRTSNNEYNQSLVADMLAKRGEAETRDLLESWMANDPEILGSDTDLLAAIEAGDCDVALTNHYYLGRALEEDPDFPVAPAWPDQDGAGAHTNISGVGMIRGSDQPDDVLRLMEFLTAPEADFVTAGSELAANPAVPPPSHIAEWADVKQDPIAVNEAGPLLADAVQLMLDVGWD